MCVECSSEECVCELVRLTIVNGLCKVPFYVPCSQNLAKRPLRLQGPPVAMINCQESVSSPIVWFVHSVKYSIIQSFSYPSIFLLNSIAMSLN